MYFVPIVETEHIPEGGTEPTNISKWKLTISAGKDRTKGNTQGNVPVVFSQSLSNIARTNYELETKRYCNVAYVAGEGEEEQRKWYEVYAKEEVAQGIEDKSGWQRNELWIDARDVQSTDEEGNNLTDEEYEQLIKQRANEKFAENEKGESYTATITEANKQYTYGTDYKLGDLVTVIDDELGITVDAQVTAVTKSIEGVREIVDIDFTYGKVNRDPVDQIGNIGGITDKNSNDIKYLENKVENIGKSYVVESGKKGIWHYRKWSDGIAELFGEWRGTLSPYSTGLYLIPEQKYPFSFVERPSDIASVTVGSGLGYQANSYGFLDNWRAVISSNLNIQTTIEARIQVKGKWK